jgi:hypothetical protein
MDDDKRDAKSENADKHGSKPAIGERTSILYQCVSGIFCNESKSRL